jgi:ABC-type oligopeptide transport system substrate-binding subunit
VLLIPMQSGSRITSTRFRRALAHSIDRRELVRRLYGGMHTPAQGGLIPPTLTGHQPDVGLRYDPDAARRLWAGQPDASRTGEPVRLLTEERFADLAAFLQESWETTLGIESALTILPFDQFLSAATEPAYELVLGQISFPLTAESAVTAPIIAGDQATPSLPMSSRPEQDWVVEEHDRMEQLRRLQEVDQRLVCDALRIPLFYSNHYVLLRDTIQSRGLNPSAAGCLDDVRAEPS